MERKDEVSYAEQMLRVVAERATKAGIGSCRACRRGAALFVWSSCDSTDAASRRARLAQSRQPDIRLLQTSDMPRAKTKPQDSTPQSGPPPPPTADAPPAKRPRGRPRKIQDQGLIANLSAEVERSAHSAIFASSRGALPIHADQFEHHVATRRRQQRGTVTKRAPSHSLALTSKGEYDHSISDTVADNSLLPTAPRLWIPQPVQVPSELARSILLKRQA